MHKCKRCGRKLTSAKSKALGFGPTCAKIDAFERSLREFKPFQIAKAIELVREGAIQPSLKRSGFYTVVSEDGDRTYLSHACGCTCPAGVKDRACYHRAAAIALNAA